MDEGAGGQDDIGIARRALAEGDLSHAARHVGRALQDDPESRTVLDLADALLRASDNALDIAPFGEPDTAGAALLRATFLERLGRHVEALPVMVKVLAVLPSRGLLARIEACSSQPGALAAVNLDAMADAGLAALKRDGLERELLPILRRLRAARGSTEKFGFLASRVERRTGHHREGLEISRAQTEATPGYWSFVSLGTALSEAGQVEEAVAAFRRALEFDPENLPVRRDIGDNLLELERFSEAAAAYEGVLQREPDDSWAKPSALFARVRAEDRPELRAELRLLAAAAAEGDRAYELYHQVEPYRVTLEPPGASLVNLAADAWRRGDAVVEVAVSSLEAPSAVLAVSMCCGRPLERAAEGISFGEVPKPDPRVAKRAVRHTIWTYQEGGLLGRLTGRLSMHARPAVLPPAPDSVRPVAVLAATRYDLDTWAATVRRVLDGQPDLGVEPMLAVMVYPPERPEGIPPWSWLFRVQVAAALALAAMAARAGEGSPGWEALMSLLFGPIDWTTTAAIIATWHLARREPGLEAAAVKVLRSLMREAQSPIEYQNVTQPLTLLLNQSGR